MVVNIKYGGFQMPKWKQKKHHLYCFAIYVGTKGVTTSDCHYNIIIILAQNTIIATSIE